MIKKIKIKELRIGMFVHDFNCGWMDHPFIKRRLTINTDAALEKVKKIGIEDLYIDTSRGLDVKKTPAPPPPERIVIKETKSEVLKTIQRESIKEEEIPKTITYQEEIDNAKEILSETKDVLVEAYDNVILGKETNLQALHPIVDVMVESISRNKDALISLLRVKEGDDYTFMHSLSVSTMLITFAKTVGIKGDLLNQYGMAGLMHDIGKMKIPLNILNKPGKLSDDEFALIQNHVVEGLEILNKDRSVSDIVLKVTAEHHERLDGSGYPNGLSGDQISLAGQMAAIVDVFDAMSSDRIFVSGIPPVVAINEIFKSRANHFKEDLVKKFINFIGIYPVGTLVKLESNRTAVVIESNHLRPIIRIVYENISRKKLMSRPIDLSQGTGLNDRIIGYEDPARIGLDMMQVMELAQLRY